MIPYFVFDHISIGPLNFYTWGFFFGLAFAVGYFLTLYRAKKKNISVQQILILTWIIFLGAALGSRVAYLLQFPNQLLSDVSLLWRFYQGGLMIWGGILGAILFFWLYVKIAKMDFWEMADLFTPAVALGIGIGRIGCFLINDHIGAATSLPWGILWPDGISRHPVALYESLVGFALFAIFWYLPFNKLRVFLKSKPAGSLFLLFLASYAAIRFFLDFLRASKVILADPRWLGLTSSQWISLGVFIFVLLFLIKRKNTKINST